MLRSEREEDVSQVLFRSVGYNCVSILSLQDSLVFTLLCTSSFFWKSLNMIWLFLGVCMLLGVVIMEEG